MAVTEKAKNFNIFQLRWGEILYHSLRHATTPVAICAQLHKFKIRITVTCAVQHMVILSFAHACTIQCDQIFFPLRAPNQFVKSPKIAS